MLPLLAKLQAPISSHQKKNTSLNLSSPSYRVSMAQRLPIYVIILLFTIFVAVSSSPTPISKASRVKREGFIALKQFNPRASYEREEEGYHPPGSPHKPRPSSGYHHYGPQG